MNNRYADFLQVFEGSDANGPDLTNGGICHTQKKPQVLTSTGNMMYIRFVSDSSVNGKGFQATYRGIRGGKVILCIFEECLLS